MEDIQTRYQKELGYFRENIAYIDRLLEEIKAKKIQIAEEQIKYIELCEQLKVEYTSHPLPSELLLTGTMIDIVSKKPEYIFLFPIEKATGLMSKLSPKLGKIIGSIRFLFSFNIFFNLKDFNL